MKSAKSFEIATQYMEQVRGYVPKDCLICLVENKVDLVEKAECKKAEGVDLCFKTSAKNNNGIAEMFEVLVNRVEGKADGASDQKNFAKEKYGEGEKRNMFAVS